MTNQCKVKEYTIQDVYADPPQILFTESTMTRLLPATKSAVNRHLQNILLSISVGHFMLFEKSPFFFLYIVPPSSLLSSVKGGY